MAMSLWVSFVLQNADEDDKVPLLPSDLTDKWGGGRLWDESRVTAYFPTGVDVPGAMKRLGEVSSDHATRTKQTCNLYNIYNRII